MTALLAAPLSAQTAGTGRVTGRVTSTQGDVLPGVTMTLVANGTTATAVTGPDGRFVIEAFVDGSTTLTLTAFLAGFQTVTRTTIRAKPGATMNTGDIRLPVGCLANVDFVATGLRDEASRALTVALLRIESVQPVREWTFEKTCYTGSDVSAVIENDLRGRRTGTRIRFVPIRSPSLPPYTPGDEIVVALQRDPASGRYFSWGYGHVVRDGVVLLEGGSSIDEFEEEVPVLTLFERLRDGWRRGTARRR